MDKYLVIWANVLEEFDDYGEAMEHARTQTFEEIYCNTAIVVSIHNDEDSQIVTADVEIVTWLPYSSTWMLTEIETC